MKTWRKVFCLCISIIVVCIGNAFALKNFYTDGIIDAGTPTTSVYTWNDANVTMTGGTITSLDTLNSSTVDIQSGTITQGTSAWQHSQLAVYGGNIGLFLESHDSAVVNLKGGSFNGWLYAEDTSVINLYAYQIHFNPDGGNWNGGLLTGLWLADGSTFTLALLNNLDSGVVTYDHVNIIPEPTTLSLLALGAAAVAEKKRRR